jgi:hypothetical protein
LSVKTEASLGQILLCSSRKHYVYPLLGYNVLGAFIETDPRENKAFLESVWLISFSIGKQLAIRQGQSQPLAASRFGQFSDTEIA